jgi:hypothetical protein
MAHIKKMTDKPRTLPFRAQVKRKGHPTLVKMFQTRSQAERWAREQEKSILEIGLPLGRLAWTGGCWDSSYQIL